MGINKIGTKEGLIKQEMIRRLQTYIAGRTDQL